MNDQPAPPMQYAELLTDIKQRIHAAQTRAMLSVNAELIRLYWELGQMLDARQKIEGWGAAVIPRLARDIRNELPEVKGFSERNIKRMLAFYREYAGLEFVPQAVAQIEASAKVPQAVALFSSDVLLALPWGHHLLLMEKLKDAQTRHWYMQATLTNGWSRNILQMQIETAAHTRQGKATSNFALRLPPPQSDLAQQALKDPYLFDFLTLAACRTSPPEPVKSVHSSIPFTVHDHGAFPSDRPRQRLPLSALRTRLAARDPPGALHRQRH